MFTTTKNRTQFTQFHISIFRETPGGGVTSRDQKCSSEKRVKIGQHVLSFKLLNTKGDIVGHTRADGANWLNKASVHQCYPTWQESSLRALMLRLGLSLRFKHDTGDKRHFVRSVNSSTDSLSWDEEQIVLLMESWGRTRTREESRCLFSIRESWRAAR